MFSILTGLFIAANALSVLIILFSVGFTLCSKIGKFRKPSSMLALPNFSEPLKCARGCFWSGTAFILINWLLCSSNAISSGAPVGFLSNLLVWCAFAWAVTLFLSFILNVTMKFIKSNEPEKYNITGAAKSSALYALLYFLLSFLIG